MAGRHLPSETVRCNEREYVLSLQFNERHGRISHLLGLARALDIDDPVLRVFTNAGHAP
jgi:hypothetical protein